MLHHPRTQRARVCAAAALCAVFLLGCAEDPRLSIPPPRGWRTPDGNGGAGRGSECDGAPQGTPCGKPGKGFHCIFDTCLRNRCGDGVRAGFEECDDGNEVDDDGCTDRCRIAACGSPGNARQECDAGEMLSVLVQVDDVGDSTTICPVVTGISALPLETTLGSDLELTGYVTSTDGAAYEWTGGGGTLSAPGADATTFHCLDAGDHELRFAVFKLGCESSAMSTVVTCTDTGSTPVVVPSGH